MGAPKPFDRAARNRMRRRSQVVVPAGARVTLLGDSRGTHQLVESTTGKPARLRHRRSGDRS